MIRWFSTFLRDFDSVVFSSAKSSSSYSRCLKNNNGIFSNNHGKIFSMTSFATEIYDYLKKSCHTQPLPINQITTKVELLTWESRKKCVFDRAYFNMWTGHQEWCAVGRLLCAVKTLGTLYVSWISLFFRPTEEANFITF